MSKLLKKPSLKDAKETGVTAGEALIGFVGGHALRGAIKSDKKFINPIAAVASLGLHMSSENKHLKSIALGLGLFFGVKSLNQLKEVAVAGLDGVEGMDGVKDFLNKIVPTLGDVEFDELSGDELARAEADLLGLMNGAEDEFTTYTEVAQAGIGSVSNL
jgi:hypothetical protein